MALSKSQVCATLPFEGLEKAEDFYINNLGLKLEYGSVDDGYIQFAAGKGTSIQVFESDSKKSNDTAATFEVKDLTREMEALKEKGITFEDYDLPEMKTVNGVATMGDELAAWFKDPGGNILCLHQSK